MDKQIKIIEWEIDEEFNLGIQATSLVDAPAIESGFVYLKSQKTGIMKEVQLKADPSDEKRMIYGAVLIPDKLIYRVDPNTGEEYYAKISAATIEKCLEGFMKKRLQQSITIQHEIAVLGVTVVEAWTKLSEADKSVALGIVEPIGSLFFGMKCDNDEVWESVKSGKVTGFSVESFFIHSLSQNSFLKELEDLISLL